MMVESEFVVVRRDDLESYIASSGHDDEQTAISGAQRRAIQDRLRLAFHEPRSVMLSALGGWRVDQIDDTNERWAFPE